MLGFAKSDRQYNKNGLFFRWRPTGDFENFVVFRILYRLGLLGACLGFLGFLSGSLWGYRGFTWGYLGDSLAFLGLS